MQNQSACRPAGKVKFCVCFLFSFSFFFLALPPPQCYQLLQDEICVEFFASSVCLCVSVCVCFSGYRCAFGDVCAAELLMQCKSNLPRGRCDVVLFAVCPRLCLHAFMRARVCVCVHRERERTGWSSV